MHLIKKKSVCLLIILNLDTHINKDDHRESNPSLDILLILLVAAMVLYHRCHRRLARMDFIQVVSRDCSTSTYT